jgi:hypothetical protein
MGWFSDALFGEKKRIDPEIVGGYMEPYDLMVDDLVDEAAQARDPQSLRNRNLLGQLKSGMYDQLATSQQNIGAMGAQTGASAGQTQMNLLANQANARGNFGMQETNFLNQQYNTGMSLFDRAMQARRGQGERMSNMYIQDVNAHNQARQNNMQMVTDLAGTALTGGLMGYFNNLAPTTTQNLANTNTNTDALTGKI